MITPARKAFSLERKAFSLERNAFSLERNCFSLVRKHFSLERNAFSLERNAFSLERKYFSLEGNAFSLAQKNHSLRQKDFLSGRTAGKRRARGKGLFHACFSFNYNLFAKVDIIYLIGKDFFWILGKGGGEGRGSVRRCGDAGGWARGDAETHRGASLRQTSQGGWASPRTLALHYTKRIKRSKFTMTKRNKNMKFKKKGNQSTIYDLVQGRLMSLFSAGWLFLEIKNLNKNLTCVIKVLRFISSPFFSFLSFQKTNV
jgi:hypothetical protein